MKWRVLGCGVSGLTTATVLAESGYEVEIWARELPPDTTSDVAAAYWHPYRASPRDPVLRWSKQTLDEFRRLALDPETGVHIAPVLQVSREPYARPWWADTVPELESVIPAEIEGGLAEFASGFTFSAPVADTSRYLPYLMQRLKSAGGRIERRPAGSLADAARGVAGVVDCCGLGARELVGDHELFPIRGEIVRVKNPGIERVLVDEHAPGGPSYIVPRRDECILGGTAIDGIEDLDPDPAAQARILEQTAKLDPRIDGMTIRSTAVGLRPGRPTVRLELDLDAAPAPVVHNYGHGGAGVTLSWGCAFEVLAIVREAGRYSGSPSSTAVP